MRRNYYSPSAVGLIERCMRAAAYCYIAGMRDPEVAWADIESGRVKVLKRGERVTKPGRQCVARSRASSLGKAVHSVFEDRYLGRDPNWFNLPGLVAASGAHLIPDPSECTVIEVERAVGTVPSGETEKGKPPLVLEIDGIRWAGFRDLLMQSEEGCARLGIGAPEGWLLVDYKSTSNIKAYAKTEAALEADIQRALYGLDTCIRSGQDFSQARWLYLETGKVRHAAPVDTTTSKDHSLSILLSKHDTIRTFDAIERVEDAPMNPAACDDYGGCPYHVSAGGPCNARRKLGSLMARAKVNKEVTIMALSPEVQARFEERKAAAAAAKAGNATPATAKPAPVAKPKPVKAPPPPVEQEEIEADVQVDEEGEVVVNTKGELVVDAIVPAAGGRAARIQFMNDQLAAKEAEIAALQEGVATLLADIAKACK
jgi:hypothetical protein